MNELFTVKLDLSGVLQDNSESNVYILMVDTRNTKMIYEFKMWIKFLFSFDDPIKLVYDGAVIHDLESVKILSLLKSIQVKLVDSTDGGQLQQQKLAEQLQRYDEWCKSSNQLISPEGINHISGLGSCDLIQITNGVQRCSPNKVNIPEVSGTIKSDDNEASGSHVNNGFSTPQNKVLGSDDCKTRTIVKDKSVSNNIYKKRQVHKPFSVGDLLTLIRSEKVNSDNEDKVVESENVIAKNSPEYEGLESVCESNDGEMVRSFEKKQRKRIRKHKSKKKYDMSNPPYRAYNSFNSYSDDGALKSPDKPKHIRFDASKDDMDYEVSCNNPATDQESVLNMLPDVMKKADLTLQQLQNIVEEKKRSLTNCISEDGIENVNSSVNDGSKWIFSQGVEMNDCDENNLKTLQGDSQKNGEDCNYDLVNALQNLRDHNGKPLIFKRFN